MPTSELERNQKYVSNNFDSLINLYKNKFILVFEEKVIGSYDSYEKAAEDGINLYGINSGFLIQFMSEQQPVNFISIAK